MLPHMAATHLLPAGCINDPACYEHSHSMKGYVPKCVIVASLRKPGLRRWWRKALSEFWAGISPPMHSFELALTIGCLANESKYRNVVIFRSPAGELLPR